MMCLSRNLLAWVLVLAAAGPARAQEPVAIEYQTQIAPIFTKYCTGCHNDADLEGGLSLESFASLQEGGNDGVALLPGQSASSRMIRMLSGEAEPRMPPVDPAGTNQPPTAEEIELLRAWIDGGAPGPDGEAVQSILITPHVPTHDGVEEPVTAVAISRDGVERQFLAVGRFQQVDVLEAASGQSVFSRQDLPGKVNAVSFSRDGAKLVVASGIAGLQGTAMILDSASGKTLVELSGHRDTLYDAVLSPDGTRLATCSYDHQIILWALSDDDAREPQKLLLSGHNGPVFDLAFSPDGTVLASASGDETIKLWRVRDGLRLDTLSQPQGEQYAVTFSPDGRYVIGGGADNRVRVWDFDSHDEPRINPLVFARFAHEGAIVDLAFSGDGRTLVSAAEDPTLKAWQTETYTETRLYDPLPDVIASLAISPDGRSVVVALMDGTWQSHDLPHPPVVLDEEDEQIVDSGGGSTSSENSDAAGSETDRGDERTAGKLAESEPNDLPSQAMSIAVPALMSGTIQTPAAGQGEDVDIYRFTSTAGEEWMIEINAARLADIKSPLDSFVEVLDSEGRPIERVVLQSIRDSYFTFRGKDSFTSDDFRVQNWEEMKLNQYLYAGGEVVKLWLYPRGPDSGFMVYPGEGRRYTYYDTTPLAHALGEPCYVVEPHPPGTKLIPNGLPAFPIYYENDDDSRRAWGSDSRLSFVAPRDGEYLVRVLDARGFGGDDFKYELTIRPRQPEYSVKLENRELTIGRGSGQEFRVTAERRDGFEGAIRIELGGLPDGMSSTSPLVIEQGQIAAYGTVVAAADAPAPSAEALRRIQFRASAEIDGRLVEKPVDGFTKLELNDPPQILVLILPAEDGGQRGEGAGEAKSEGAPPAPLDFLAAAEPLELSIRPGETIAARVRLVRRDFDGEVSLGGFDAGRNLPHGVYVDNIGLNGLTLLEGQSERVFFITADDWVGSQSRTFHLKASAPGNPTSPPVILHVE